MIDFQTFSVRRLTAIVRIVKNAFVRYSPYFQCLSVVIFLSLRGNWARGILRNPKLVDKTTSNARRSQWTCFKIVQRFLLSIQLCLRYVKYFIWYHRRGRFVPHAPNAAIERLFRFLVPQQRTYELQLPAAAHTYLMSDDDWTRPLDVIKAIYNVYSGGINAPAQRPHAQQRRQQRHAPAIVKLNRVNCRQRVASRATPALAAAPRAPVTRQSSCTAQYRSLSCFFRLRSPSILISKNYYSNIFTATSVQSLLAMQ